MIFLAKRSLLSRFPHRHDTAPGYGPHLLDDARRPPDLDQIRGRIGSQPEMHRSRARRRIPRARSHVVVLRPGFCNDFNSRANAVAVALRSLQLELQPMILARTLIDPHRSEEHTSELQSL